MDANKDSSDITRKELLKLHKAVESSDEAIFITDLEGIITYVNPGFSNLYGYTSQEVVGLCTPRILKSGLLSPSEYEDFWKTILNKEVVRKELINKAKNGKLITVDVSANPIVDDEGDIIGFIGIHHDITEKKQVEIAFKKSEELFRKSFMTSPDAINVNRTSDGMFISVNAGFTNILGYNPEDVIGKTSLDLNIWANPEVRKKIVNELSEKGILENFEAEFRKKNGEIVFGLMSASVINLEGVSHILSITKDITEYKKAEELNILLANALKGINECVSITDINDRVIFLNRAFQETYGFTEEDLKDQSISHIRSSNNPPEIVKEILPATLKGGWSGEIFNRKKDGTEFLVSLSTASVMDLDGVPLALIGVATDITEKKKIEESLRHSEERFRSVTQSANDAIISIDGKGRIFGWNHGAEVAFGYSEQEIMGSMVNILIPGDLLDKHIKGIVRLEMRSEKKPAGGTVEINGKRKNGSTFPLELSLSEWETSEGKFFTGIIRDITRRKRTELDNQIMYEITQGISLTSNLDELLKLIHLSLGKAVYAENFFIALKNESTGLFSFPYYVDKIDTTPNPTNMGKSCSSYVFRTVQPFLYSDEEYQRLEKLNEVELIGTPSPSWVGIPLQTPDRVLGVMVLQHYEKENVYSGEDLKFLTSIGGQIAFAIERKLAEEEIKLKNVQLQNLNSEKDKFFSILAHDLRGPLSAFVGATEIISEEIRTMSVDEILDITQSMKKSATGIYSLLENLLEWSRLQRGVMDFIPEEINLKKIIVDSANVLAESASKKNIEIKINIEDNLIVLADKHMFGTIIRNLVSNALKFTKVGGSISITAYYQDNKSVVIRVSDSGIGMSAELVNKLFKIDEKVNRPGTEGEPSTGLGLLLCKEFIVKHNGNIWVESEIGKGTTFTFQLPK